MGAVLGAALQTPGGGRTRGLYIDGLDVIGRTGQSYGVLVDTLRVTEAGPGNVSRLDAVIDDPQSVLSFSEKAIVRFEDLTRGTPIFLGFLLLAEPQREGLNRTITIQAVGVESLLDWMLVPATMTVGATSIAAATLAVVAASLSVGFPLRALADPAATYSTQAYPVGGSMLPAMTAAVTITGPTTLRQALAALVQGLEIGAGKSVVTWTVDFWGGLRMVWSNTTAILFVTDWERITVSTAGPAFPVDTAHVRDSSSTVHMVYVTGGNAAATGLVTDGSGITGPIGTLNDSTLTTAALRDAAGLAWLNAHASNIRGSVGTDGTYNIGAPGTERHAGGLLRITDATMGLSAYDTFALQIDKSFRATDEAWTITYGTTAPSGAKLIRQLTRSVVN